MHAGEELLPIGTFARLSGLTVKALRHYDEIGLLRPAHVDETTGYRYYTLAQAREAEAIRRLRALELPLDEVASLLGADDDALRSHLAVHRARLEGRAAELRRLRDELARLIEGREPLVPDKTKVMFELRVDDVPVQHVLVVDEGGDADPGEPVAHGIRVVREYLRTLGVEPSGPALAVCSGMGEDGAFDVATGWPVAEEVPGSGHVEKRTLPATRALVMKHMGSYDALSRSYRLMREAMADSGLNETGPPREIYVTDPQKVLDPNEYETLIVWPIGPEGELDVTRDRFKKRIEIEP